MCCMSENSVKRGRISRRKKSQFSRRSGRQARQDVYNSRELEMGDTSLPFQHSTRVKVGSGSQVTVSMHLPTLLLLCPRAVALQGVRRYVAQVLVGRQGRRRYWCSVGRHARHLHCSRSFFAETRFLFRASPPSSPFLHVKRRASARITAGPTKGVFTVSAG